MVKKVHEHAEQTALVTRCRTEKILIFSIPNGFYVSNKAELYAQLGKLKQEGLLSGAPDLIVVLPNKILFIEMKIEGGKLSQAQIDIHNQLNELGFNVAVFYNAKSAWQYIEEQRKQNYG